MTGFDPRPKILSLLKDVRWGKCLYWLIILVFLILAGLEAIQQQSDTKYLEMLAKKIIQQAHAEDKRAQVIALRAYLQRSVQYQDASIEDRPFLRSCTVDTLWIGKGYCGEVTRAFIRLAGTLGIRAQRINLYGKLMHVVAEAELGPDERVIVDCQNPPQVQDLEPLDRVILRPEYDDYSTLNLRRLRLGWLISRVKLEMGPLTFWTENPHALQAALWMTVALGLVMMKVLLLGGRALALSLLAKKGWVRSSDVLTPAMTETELARRHLVGMELNHKTQPTFCELRCPVCSGIVELGLKSLSTAPWFELRCAKCAEAFPIVNDIPRMLVPQMRQALARERDSDLVLGPDVAAAESFGYEWSRFPEMRAEWRQNFLAYMLPHGPEFFPGKRVLDAGCGSGRHAYYAAQYGAVVWAIDLGSAVEVAQRNTREIDRVHVAQADIHQLPFEPESFDFIYAIGVLHHLSDPEEVFHNLLRYLKPGGWIQIYLYWKPEGQPIKQALLALIKGLRGVTTRLPHWVTLVLSYPAAAAAYAGFVWPYQLLNTAGLRSVAERMPMKQYAVYPFRVCVNDQFDRLSAPIEHRFKRDEVLAWFERAKLEDVSIRDNFGWCATGRKPREENRQD